MLDDHWPDNQDLDAQDGLQWLAPFAQDVRFASRGPVPIPAPELATLLGRRGAWSDLSTEKGDLLATAASNVHGPAPQVAGLPNTRKEIPMSIAFLTTLLGKIAGAGTAAKATVATLTAAATMTVAGAAAGVLPAPIQGAVGTAINAISPLNVPTDDAVETATGIVDGALAGVPGTGGAVPGELPVSADVTVETPAGTVSAGTSSLVDGLAVPGLPEVPGLPGLPEVPGLPGLPDVGGLVGSLPVPLPACVTNLVPTSGALPNPSTLLAQLPGCIQTVLGTASLPVDVSTCVASVLGMVTGVLNPGAVGTLPTLDVSACVPLDTTACTANVLAATNGGSPLVRNMLGTLFGGTTVGGALDLGVPGLSAIPAGCVPINISDCLTNVVDSLGTLPTTGVPEVNLSACMPTGLTAGIPGLGGGIPGLGGIPFLPFG